MPHTCRILLAEDNATNQKVALLQLKKIGFSADTALNGREAVQRCLEHEYDIILMDCQMPEVDGYEATRILRRLSDANPPKLGKRPRIIALTANALRGDRDKCLAAGMDDYLAKPVTLHDLREVILRNFQTAPEVAASVKAAIAPSARQLVDLKRFNSVARDDAGEMDAEAFEIFRSAMMELPGRLDSLGKLTGEDLAKEAHQLRGMVSVFGFKQLAEDLGKLEAAACTADATELSRQVKALRDICADSILELAEQVPEIAGL